MLNTSEYCEPDNSTDSDNSDGFHDCQRITHNDTNISFNVCGYTSIWWYSSYYNTWEPNTFHIIKDYSNSAKNTYIDIGSWIGPTVLFAANMYENVIAIEPDPVALKKLENNIAVNKFNNITVVNKALTIIDDIIKFGGNGCMGNSESTMLVNNEQYINEHWGGRWSKEQRKQDIIEVDGITIRRLFCDYNIDPNTIALIKMDIEGGEFILVPDIIHVLYEYNIPLYISIHYVFLKDEHIKFILKVLFATYNNCYVYINGKKTAINSKTIFDEKYTELIFENVKSLEKTDTYCNNPLSCCFGY